MNVYLTLVAALIAPIMLIPVEHFLPYPHVVEELVKLLLVLIYVRGVTKGQTSSIVVILLGCLFALSENVLYLLNFLQTGSLNVFLVRIGVTTVLHVFTIICMYVSGKKWMYGYIGGFVVAVMTHYLYNSIVATVIVR